MGMMKSAVGALFAITFLAVGLVRGAEVAHVEQWGRFEVTLNAPAKGNPFVDVNLSAQFTCGSTTVTAAGFYDGDGVYRIRFMPGQTGEWKYQTTSNLGPLDGAKGAFVCDPPSPANHGPVQVKDVHHFGYADGTPFYPLGTTCYAWIHQTEDLQQQTLKTLSTAPFNKIRMCVFPKNYAYNKNEPLLYPFEKGADGKFDWTRFNPAFFRHLEQRVGELGDLGIQADLILFHPYDEGRWGFDRMSPETDRRYLRYVVARLAAYRNVWWSLANEYDFMRSKKMSDWDEFFQIVQSSDPSQHLRSVHYGSQMYDYTKPWVTHASVQSDNFQQAKQWRRQYNKPVIYDECQYEGNIHESWGNISAQELVHRFWLGTSVGCYVTHGETYRSPGDVLWWSKGGELHGESPARIAFLRKIIEGGPPVGLEPLDGNWELSAAGRKGNDYILVYLGVHQPAEVNVPLPTGMTYKAEVIDTWNMTITPLAGEFRRGTAIPLPGKPYLALRLQRVTGS